MNFDLIHYQPAGRTSVCGFKRHVIEETSAGRCEEFAVLKIPTTTDVTRVTCPKCALWLEKAIVNLVNTIGSE